MRRMRTFNESKEKIDYKYIYYCFSDLIDDGIAEIELIEGDNIIYPHVVRIRLKTKPETHTSIPKSIENSALYDYITNHNSNNEILKDLEVSLNRLKDEYPYYKLRSNNYDTSLFIEIFIENDGEEYPF